MPRLTGAEPAGWLRDAEQQDVVSFQDANIHHRTAKELPGSSVKVTPVLACQGPVTGCMAMKSLHTEAGERKAKIWQKLLLGTHTAKKAGTPKFRKTKEA